MTAAKHTNRLAKETSPYLLQHQHNPVDWYAWGPDAFEAARSQNKPIFLSVGYSTCYWCHVMERQSFENDSVAAEMNKRFINIKVDREERADVDQLYMTAVQVLTRHGGWPMSVFLTPELKPFYGGTYFPPTDQFGRPGFVTILKAIEEAYRERRDEVSKSAEQLVNILDQLAEPAGPSRKITVNDEWIEELVQRSTSDYDPEYGGFGSAPKFPRETVLELLLVHNRHFPSERRMEMLRHTLDALAAGGIRDQLGGGFHRYSTDARWLVPHFEIMLYDNAMLAWIYTEAYRQTEERRYAEVARGILDFILREMTDATTGAFYTAFDAEVDAMEGLSYLWTTDEIEDILGKEDAKVFNRVYGVEEGPNFADPHHGSGQPDKNILFLPESLASAATYFKLSEDELKARLAPMRQKLYEARSKRKQPLLDTKILTSWNALMIRAMAYAGQTLAEPKYTDAAARSADFLLWHHRLSDGGLARTSREGSPAKFNGFLDDYAFAMQALLALRDASGDERWKDHAAAIAILMLEKFGDPNAGGFYFTDKSATDLIVRQKTATDSPLPSGNAVAAMALLELGHADRAREAIATFAGQMEQNGEGMSAMVEATLHYLQQNKSFEVAPAKASDADRPLSPQELAASVVLVSGNWVSTTRFDLQLDILRGFHINAHEASEGLIGTQVSIAEGADIVEGIDYPPGEVLALAFSDKPIRVYTDRVTIAVRLRADRDTSKPLRLALVYQACDDNACLPPVKRQVEIANP